MFLADVIQRFLPVAQAEVVHGAFHFLFTPGEFAVGDVDQFLRRVGDELGGECIEQRFAPDRIADHRLVLLVFNADEFFANVFCVLFEVLFELLIGLAHPPGEHRIVTGVKIIPALQDAAGVVDFLRGAICDNFAGLIIRALQRFEL